VSDEIKISVDEIIGDAKKPDQPKLIENIFYSTPGLTVIQATVFIKYLIKEVQEKIGYEHGKERDKQYL